jgi:LacI family transcriptional regulator
MKNERNKTIGEIAKLAGVSKTTVSRVLSGKTNLVKNETLKKISKVIEEQNYRPSIIARSLRTKKTRLIGLILADIENPFYARVAKGVLDEAENLNYTVIISNSNYDFMLEKKLLDTFVSRQVEGLLLTTMNLSESTIQTIQKAGIPFILIDTKTEKESVNYVTGDNNYGGKLAAEYFIKAGHKNIGYLGCDKLNSLEERKSGFKEMLKQNNLNYGHEVKLKEILAVNEIFEDIKKLVAEKKITAFFAGNDYIAIQVLNYVTNDLKLKVPEDFSLIGYDNISMSAVAKVPLSTIMQPKYSMGKIAVEQLVQLIKNNNVESTAKIVFKPELIERQSVKSLIKQ